MGRHPRVAEGKSVTSGRPRPAARVTPGRMVGGLRYPDANAKRKSREAVVAVAGMLVIGLVLYILVIAGTPSPQSERQYPSETGRSFQNAKPRWGHTIPNNAPIASPD